MRHSSKIHCYSSKFFKSTYTPRYFYSGLEGLEWATASFQIIRLPLFLLKTQLVGLFMGFWGNMRFNTQILSYLKAHGEFCTWVEQHLKESGKDVDNTLDQIVNTVIYGIGIQCIPNLRAEEMFKMAKELATTEITDTWFLPDMALQIKGNGANSEIFGARFGGIVNTISSESNLKASSVYRLFAVLTPLILADIYYNYKSPNYSIERMDKLISKIIKGIRLSSEIRENLLSLQKKRTYHTVNDQPLVQGLVLEFR